MGYTNKDLDTFINEHENKSTDYLEYLADMKNQRKNCKYPIDEVYYRYSLINKIYFKKIT
jgi:hypothetical protein